MAAGSRRERGELEDEVLTAVRSAGRPVAPGAVRDLLDRDLAYTTVMTILVRLQAKGLLSRERSGRAFAYRPVEPATRTALLMRKALDAGDDRGTALARFVEHLEPDDLPRLRQLLSGAEEAGQCS